MACAECLYRLGFGYDRISKIIRVKKKRVVRFISLRVRKRGLVKGLKRPKKIVIRIDPVLKLALRVKSKAKKKRVKHLRRTIWRWLFLYENSPMAENMTGCSKGFFVSHIASQFEEWMTWGNYGTKWELDHIVPCNVFDLSDVSQIKACFHFTNYRPLGVTENRKKSYKRL